MANDIGNSKVKMPLEGIRVLEYGVFHAGPGAAAILGDLGAEVIKIEYGAGDPCRQWTTVAAKDLSMPDGESFMFQVSNRNKKGISFDINKGKGREIFARLVNESDVFVTNLRKSTKADLSIDYEAMTKINPRIIHASISGFGPEGPDSDLGAFDPMGQARSGFMFATGTKEPRYINFAIVDQATAITATHAILTALFVRERQGIGQEVHVSLYGSALWLLYNNVMIYGGLSFDPSKENERTNHSPLRNWFCCKDGKWILGTHHPEQKYWPAFCDATGQTSLLSDPRFIEFKNPGIREELLIILDKVFITKTQDEWLDLFHSKGLMFCAVRQMDEVFTDAQAVDNGYLVDFDLPPLGNVKIPGYPVHFSTLQAGTRFTAPRLGQHTDEIMKDLGFTVQEINEMKKEGVIK